MLSTIKASYSFNFFGDTGSEFFTSFVFDAMGAYDKDIISDFIKNEVGNGFESLDWYGEFDVTFNIDITGDIDETLMGIERKLKSALEKFEKHYKLKECFELYERYQEIDRNIDREKMTWRQAPFTSNRRRLLEVFSYLTRRILRTCDIELEK